MRLQQSLISYAIPPFLSTTKLPKRSPPNPIFHGLEFVNNELREGSYFFGDIKKEGVLFFTTNRYQLEEKRDRSPAEVQAKAQKSFDKWFESANDFYFQYENAFNHEKFVNAAFQLHQAVERYYGAIPLVFTGYKPKMHDIEILGKPAKIKAS